MYFLTRARLLDALCIQQKFYEDVQLYIVKKVITF